MRLRSALVFILIATIAHASGDTAPPAELVDALKSFHADPPAGWSFTQTTTAQNESLVERCDGAKPAFARWTLLAKDGRAPTDEDLRRYAEMRSLRSRGGTAPKVTDQIDLTSIRLARDAPDQATYHARLVPGERRDTTASHLRVTIVFHKPSATIETLELASLAPFSPTLGVRIAEMTTTLRYSLPTDNSPALPLEVTTRVRGRAFWFKSLDADMTVKFSDYEARRQKQGA